MTSTPLAGLAFGRQRQRQRVHDHRPVGQQGVGFFGHDHRARLLGRGHQPGHVVQRQRVFRLQLQHLAVAQFGLRQVARSERKVAQVVLELGVARVVLQPVGRVFVGRGFLLGGRQRDVHTGGQFGGVRCRLQAGVVDLQGLVPALERGLDAAFEQEADVLGGALFLDVLGHADGLGGLVVGQVGIDHGALRLQVVGRDRQRPLEALHRTFAVLRCPLHIGQPQVGQRRLRQQLRQLVEGGQGLVGVARSRLRAAQGLQDVGVVGQGGSGRLAQLERGLEVLVGQLVVDQRQPRRRVAAVLLDRVGEDLDDLFARRAGAGFQPRRGQQGLHVARVGLHGLVEQTLGLVGFAVDQRQLGQRRGGGIKRRIGLQGLLEGHLGLVLLALLHQHPGAQVGGDGFAGQLLLQRVDGLHRAGVILLAHERTDQRQVGGGGVVGRGQGLQLRHSGVVVALQQLADGQCGLGAFVVGVELRGLGKRRFRIVEVTGLQVRLRRQRVHGRRRVGALQQRLQRGQGLGRLRHLQVGQREHAARNVLVRRLLQRLGQVGLGLQEGLLLELHRAGQLQDARVVRRHAQQRLRHLARLVVLLREQGHVAGKVGRLRVVGQHLLQGQHLLTRALQVLFAQQQRDQGAVRRHEVGLDGDGLFVGLDGLVGIPFAVVQQVALQLPGVVVLRGAADLLVHRRQGAVQVAGVGLQPGLEDLGRAVIGHGLQRCCHGRLRLIAPPHGAVGHRQRGFQVGIGQRVGQAGLAELLGQLLVLAFDEHGPRQLRHDGGLGVAQVQRLAQLQRGRGRVAAGQHGLAQQETGLGVVGIGLQHVLDLDDRGLGVVLGEQLLGRSEQLVGAVAATGHQGGSGQGQKDRGEGAGQVFHRHSISSNGRAI